MAKSNNVHQNSPVRGCSPSHSDLSQSIHSNVGLCSSCHGGFHAHYHSDICFCLTTDDLAVPYMTVAELSWILIQ